MWIDDQILARHEEPVALEIFVPKDTVVVLGSGNAEATEVDTANCKSLNIPVLRRYGGGGTVVLYPGCVVVSIGAWVKDPFNNSHYFRCLNNAVIQALASEWPLLAKLSQSGISDIVFEDRKVAGTSLFRSRQYLLYQASILVALDRPLISQCLKHPTKEPDYRKGRGHDSFLTSLGELSSDIKSSQAVQNVLQKNLAGSLVNTLGAELIAPVETQMKSLNERLERANKNLTEILD